MALNTTALRIVKALTEDDPKAAAKREAKPRAGQAGGRRAKKLTEAERKDISSLGTPARWPKRPNG